MRTLFVAISLPNSLTIENCFNIPENQEVLVAASKSVSKTYASASKVRNPIISNTLDQFNAQKSSEPPRRSRSHSTTSQRSSISFLASQEHEDIPEMSKLNIAEHPKARWKFTEQPGHVTISAASGISEGEKLFIGWPGPITDEKGNELDHSTLNSELIRKIKTLYRSETDSVPVFIDSNSMQGHQSYCSNTIWPIFHYSIWEDPMVQCKLILKDWDQYVKVNEAFLDQILDTYKAGDCIWILDHQLLLLPEMLRKKLPNVPICLYLRNTFPSSEFFRCIPHADKLLKGMLSANLIGFQAYAYVRHFSSCCTRILGLEASMQQIDFEGSPVRLAVIPTGVEADEIFETLQSEEVKEKKDRFVQLYKGRAILLGIDHYNQTKGVIHKLDAYEQFIKLHPEWIDKIILVQIILPEGQISAAGSRRIDKANEMTLITEKAARINSVYGTLEYNPVILYHQDIELSEYFALLQVADCYMATQERDSLSLVPLDFIICQEFSGKRSPIILSEFTALSLSLCTALHINPWDKSDVAKKISSALLMQADEKQLRHQILLDYAVKHSRNKWSQNLYSELMASKELIEKYGPTLYLDFNLVKKAYMESTDRYFFLDYDGTLTPIVKNPSAAIPGSKTLESLKLLCKNPRNKIFVVSGRDCATLEHWLGNISDLGMSAEHGCYLRMPGKSKDDWEDLIADHSEDWKEQVMHVFEYFTERTPGSFIETKRASITWHYRQSDSEFGAWQAKQCQSLLENIIPGKLPVEIIAGKKNLEVRPISVNKGETLRKILTEGTPEVRANFIFCAGDDRTDEDMFEALAQMEDNKDFSKMGLTEGKGHLFTCTIGPSEKKTLAKYHVNNPDQLINLLLQLTAEE